MTVDNISNKFVLFKGLYWNHPVKLIADDRLIAEDLMLSCEQKMMQEEGIFNMYANEDLAKHRALIDYLYKEFGIEIKFKLNDEPYILSDFQLTQEPSKKNVKDFLEISDFGVYQLTQLGKEHTGKFVCIIHENQGFEFELENAEDFIFDSKSAAEVGVTEYLVEQMSDHFADFARVQVDQMNTSEFKSLIISLNYFEFVYDHSIILPTERLQNQINSMSEEELLKVKSDMDLILAWAGVVVYEIKEI